MSHGCGSLTWKDLMKVHRRVLIPSPLLRSLTNLITLNKRKKVIEMRALSSVFWGEGMHTVRWGRRGLTMMPLPSKCSMVEVWATSVHYSCNHWQMHSVVSELRCQNVSALIPVSPCAQLYSHTWWRACGPWHRGTCGAYTRNAFTLWTPDFKAATFSSHKTTANLPSTNETNIHMVSGSVMQIFFFFFFSVNQTIFFAAM